MKLREVGTIIIALWFLIMGFTAGVVTEQDRPRPCVEKPASASQVIMP